MDERNIKKQRGSNNSKHKCEKQKYKILEENIKEYLNDLWVSEGFLKGYIKCIYHKGKDGESDYIKIKNFYLSENAIRRVRTHAISMTN